MFVIQQSGARDWVSAMGKDMTRCWNPMDCGGRGSPFRGGDIGRRCLLVEGDR